MFVQSYNPINQTFFNSPIRKKSVYTTPAKGAAAVGGGAGRVGRTARALMATINNWKTETVEHVSSWRMVALRGGWAERGGEEVGSPV